MVMHRGWRSQQLRRPCLPAVVAMLASVTFPWSCGKWLTHHRRGAIAACLPCPTLSRRRGAVQKALQRQRRTQVCLLRYTTQGVPPRCRGGCCAVRCCDLATCDGHMIPDLLCHSRGCCKCDDQMTIHWRAEWRSKGGTPLRPSTLAAAAVSAQESILGWLACLEIPKTSCSRGRAPPSWQGCQYGPRRLMNGCCCRST